MRKTTPTRPAGRAEPSAAVAPAGERTVLVLQGGGALGAYQAGACEALAAAGHHPDWVAGISIGAINAAIIAGNPPERRVERLHSFWRMVSAELAAEPVVPGELARMAFNEASAALVSAFGVPGFFRPRVPPAVLFPPGAPQALSVYDTTPLRATLESLVDFDLINERRVRLSIGAVNVRTGNFEYFDNARQLIGPEHIMASGALPPGLPPVEIEGELYWDGGLVSNTPLHYVMDERPRRDMVVFQIDLFSARGPVPRTLSEADERAKDIRFSSRTRLNTDMAAREQATRRALSRLLDKLPERFADDPDVQLLRAMDCDDAAVTIVHLIHRRKTYQTQSKDYEFSRRSMLEYWQAGREDVRRTLRDRHWCKRARPQRGVAVLDLARDGAAAAQAREKLPTHTVEKNDEAEGQGRHRHRRGERDRRGDRAPLRAGRRARGDRRPARGGGRRDRG